MTLEKGNGLGQQPDHIVKDICTKPAAQRAHTHQHWGVELGSLLPIWLRRMGTQDGCQMLYASGPQTHLNGRIPLRALNSGLDLLNQNVQWRASLSPLERNPAVT